MTKGFLDPIGCWNTKDTMDTKENQWDLTFVSLVSSVLSPNRARDLGVFKIAIAGSLSARAARFDPRR
jgi:hypothetical protein